MWWDGHSRKNRAKHDDDVLACLLDQPGRAQQSNDNASAQNHCQQLGLQHGEVEALDDDVCEGAQAGRGQRDQNLDQREAPGWPLSAGHRVDRGAKGHKLWGSVKASTTCSLRNVLFCRPVWLSRTRSTISFLSSSEKQLARMGESGM